MNNIMKKYIWILIIAVIIGIGNGLLFACDGECGPCQYWNGSVCVYTCGSGQGCCGGQCFSTYSQECCGGTPIAKCDSDECMECNGSGGCTSYCTDPDYPYCDGSGNCVECLNDSHCPGVMVCDDEDAPTTPQSCICEDSPVTDTVYWPEDFVPDPDDEGGSNVKFGPFDVNWSTSGGIEVISKDICCNSTDTGWTNEKRINGQVGIGGSLTINMSNWPKSVKNSYPFGPLTVKTVANLSYGPSFSLNGSVGKSGVIEGCPGKVCDTVNLNLNVSGGITANMVGSIDVMYYGSWLTPDWEYGIGISASGSALVNASYESKIYTGNDCAEKDNYCIILGAVDLKCKVAASAFGYAISREYAWVICKGYQTDGCGS